MSSSESEGSSDSMDVAMQETQVSHLQRPRKRPRAAMDDSSAQPNIDVPMEDPMHNPFECPSKILKKYAKGPFNPKKPLLQFATKVDNNKKKIRGVVGNGSAIYVRNIILGVTQECIVIFYG